MWCHRSLKVASSKFAVAESIRPAIPNSKFDGSESLAPRGVNNF
jgi:hypothetical protein